METINTYVAYHATDTSNVDSILKNNFTFKHCDKHWLGDGVYFFIDKYLAIHWCTVNTKNYGEITEGAILKVQIEADTEKTYDTRNTSDYNFIKKDKDEFYNRIINNETKEVYISNKKLRCAFFNWFRKKTNCVCIIATFNERVNLSEFTKHGDRFLSLRIPYIEVQMCVFDNKIINNIEIIDVEDE